MRKLMVWCGRLAMLVGIASAVLLAVQGHAYQAGWADLRVIFFKIFPVITIAGGSAALLGLIALFGGKLGGARAVVMGLVGLLAGAGAAAVPIAMKRMGESVPPIHDITTDTANPPEFVAIAPLRADAPNPVTYDPSVADKQRQGYPQLETFRFNASRAAVFAAALEAVTEAGLELVEANQEQGRIEATATTRWFGFKDDVVIRLGRTSTETLLDARSKSRVGVSDLGANAKRIETIVGLVQAKL